MLEGKRLCEAWPDDLDSLLVDVAPFAPNSTALIAIDLLIIFLAGVLHPNEHRSQALLKGAGLQEPRLDDQVPLMVDETPRGSGAATDAHGRQPLGKRLGHRERGGNGEVSSAR